MWVLLFAQNASTIYNVVFQMNPCSGGTHPFIAYVLLLNYFIVCHISFINFLLLIMLL